MGSVVISGATSGAVTLAVPDEAGTRTLTLPATTGTILTNDISQAGDTSAGNAAAVGYTSAEGLILTGQGTTSDVTIKNDADATVLSIPTGTTNVGIGTTSPTTQLTLRNNTSAIAPIVTLLNDSFIGSEGAAIDFTYSQTQPVGARISSENDGNFAADLVFSTKTSGATGNALSERMRIDSGGNVSVGTTSAVSNARLAVERIGGVGNEAAIGFTSSGTAKWKIGNNASDSFVVYTPSNVGVYINSGATSWTATSDERLKNITGNIENALDAVQTLRAVKFTWIADDENKSQVGLIAQDVQAVLPEVITEDAEGYLGIRYTETIPLLVAAIQEQQTTIEALEARITALEAG